MSETLPTRTDRRRAQTRLALMTAGRILLANHDVDVLTIDEIVGAADVAKGSFYNHFPDKATFATAVGTAVLREVEGAINQANAGVEEPATRLARALCVFVRFAVESPEGAQILLRSNTGSTMADDPANKEVLSEVAHALKQLGAPIDAQTGVLLVIGIISVAMRHVLESKSKTPAVDVAGNLAAGLMRAIGLPARRAQTLAVGAASQVFEAVRPHATSRNRLK